MPDLVRSERRRRRFRGRRYVRPADSSGARQFICRTTRCGCQPLMGQTTPKLVSWPQVPSSARQIHTLRGLGRFDLARLGCPVSLESWSGATALACQSQQIPLWDSENARG